jgi:hypothetical protein
MPVNCAVGPRGLAIGTLARMRRCKLCLDPGDMAAFERYDQRFDSRTGLGGLEIWIPVEEVS